MAEQLRASKSVADPPTIEPTRDPADECAIALSSRDAERVLEAVQNPPLPNATALEAAKRYKLQNR